MKLETCFRLKQNELMLTLRKIYKGKTANCKPSKYLLVKGNTPILLIAHLDTVHKTPVKEICMTHDGNIIMSPQGIGGDDRCGVYALNTVYSRSQVKPWLLFTCDEEIGGIGAHEFADDYKSHLLHKGLNSIKLLVELDRKGHNEAVYYDCDNPDLMEYITSKGFETNYGSYSDIATIAPVMGVAAVNLSAGYYDAHTTHETVNRAHLNDSITKVCSIVADAAQKDFPKYEYIEAEYEINRYEPHCFAHFGYYLSQVPKDVPVYYREMYADLLDYYTLHELEDLRKSYGDQIIEEIYEYEFEETCYNDPDEIDERGLYDAV